MLLLFYAITLWSSLLLADCHDTNGVKHPTYRAAVMHVLGTSELAEHFVQAVLPDRAASLRAYMPKSVK